MLTVWNGAFVKPDVMQFEIKDKSVLSTHRRRDVVAFKILLHEHLGTVSAGMFNSPCRLGSLRNPGHRKKLAIRIQFFISLLYGSILPHLLYGLASRLQSTYCNKEE